MRLLYVADGRSPIALNWISHFVQAGHEVHLISTFPCEPELQLASLTVVPVAFGAVASRIRRGGLAGRRYRGGARGIRLRTALRHWLGPLTVPAAARRARAVVDKVQPDLVHAMRIPFEGMLAAEADPSAPLLLSIWGNDLTLHAPAAPGVARLTRRALRRADGLHADCRRDLRLARRWGFPEARPAVVLPGNGGVRVGTFHPGDPGPASPGSPLEEALRSIPAQAPVVVNPRGFRAYVRNDSFFMAVPRVLAANPGAVFLCPAMAGERQAERWLTGLGIGHAVRLLPRLSAADMGAVYRRADVGVSPSEHDGTPNTLLEAMACGCFPVAGDLESIREWIQDGTNGLLVDPGDPAALAEAVNRALADEGLRARAAAHNAKVIAKRATYDNVMAEAEAFYREIIG